MPLRRLVAITLLVLFVLVSGQADGCDSCCPGGGGCPADSCCPGPGAPDPPDPTSPSRPSSISVSSDSDADPCSNKPHDPMKEVSWTVNRGSSSARLCVTLAVNATTLDPSGATAIILEPGTSGWCVLEGDNHTGNTAVNAQALAVEQESMMVTGELKVDGAPTVLDTGSTTISLKWDCPVD